MIRHVSWALSGVLLFALAGPVGAQDKDKPAAKPVPDKAAKPDLDKPGPKLPLKTPKPPSPAEAKGNQAPKPVSGKNLLYNGDFEEGDLTPKGWQAVDGLSTFYIKDIDPSHGKVIKFDTDVLQSQAYEWWPKIARGVATAKEAPSKLPTVEPKYDTLAGLDGVWFWSDAVPVEEGKAYWLSLDVKGPAIYAWVVGYTQKPDLSWGADNAAFSDVLKSFDTGKPVEKGRGFDGFIHKYVWKGQLAAGGPNEWKTYSRRAKPFRPTYPYKNVRWVRVMLYPYWPPDSYYVDNVRLVEVEDNGVDKPGTLDIKLDTNKK